jgi:tRNA threonylcarbamoyl adenosine modification protein YeaZ
MLLLAIETSSARGSLALLDGRSLLAEAPFPEGLVHGREITVHLEAMMERLALPAARLEAVAVGLGPGSYTGMRVGVTAAKTLAFALRIPLLVESSLQVIAAAALRAPPPPGSSSPLRIAVSVDGKQRHLYLARFRIEETEAGPRLVREVEERVVELPRAALGGRERVRPGPAPPGPAALPPELEAALRDLLLPGTVVVGDGADALLAACGPSSAVRGPREWDWPRASVLGALAAERIEASPPRFDPEAVHRLVPIYLRLSQAERLFPEGLPGSPGVPPVSGAPASGKEPAGGGRGIGNRR